MDERATTGGRVAHDDVIVVGAGPVGLVAALLLVDAGVRATVVEKATCPGDEPRAISLQDESLRTFERLGIADALKAQSLLDTGSRYFGRNERLLLEARPIPSRIGHPAKTQFDQPVLERLLWDRAVAHPRLRFLRGAKAVAVTRDTDGVSVDVDVDGSVRTLTAGWLIGADGGRSFTRQALGIDLAGTTQPQRWIVIDLLNERHRRDPFAEFHCDGKRPYVLVPGAGGRLRIEFMLFDGEDADAMTTPEQIRDLVVPAFRAELDPADVRRAAVYVAHQRVARRYRSGRAFLVGDAAHLMPPFAGQGLNAGVRDATNLVWKLIEAIRGGASDRLLDSYEIERRDHGAKMVTVSRRIGKVVMATHPVATRLRDRLVRIARLMPSVRDFLANMRFITPPDYGNGIVAGSRDAPLPGIETGRALSQPAVVGAAGDESGLDRYLGDGWVLLQIGGHVCALQDRHDYWTAIGAARVRMLPAGSTPSVTTRTVENTAEAAELAADAVTEVAEVVPQLAVGNAPEPVFVVVRPDRYIAAVFTAPDEGTVVAELRAFVDDRARAARSAGGRESEYA